MFHPNNPLSIYHHFYQRTKILVAFLFTLSFIFLISCADVTTPDTKKADVTTPDIKKTTPDVTMPDVTTPDVTMPVVTPPDVTPPPMEPTGVVKLKVTYTNNFEAPNYFRMHIGDTMLEVGTAKGRNAAGYFIADGLAETNNIQNTTVTAETLTTFIDVDDPIPTPIVNGTVSSGSIPTPSGATHQVGLFFEERKGAFFYNSSPLAGYTHNTEVQIAPQEVAGTTGTVAHNITMVNWFDGASSSSAFFAQVPSSTFMNTPPDNANISYYLHYSRRFGGLSAYFPLVYDEGTSIRIIFNNFVFDATKSYTITVKFNRVTVIIAGANTGWNYTITFTLTET